ncbi:MAG TPA: PCYCGC motif-containing (lipo)protein, partial [Gemmatimonadaceae bacterium]
LPRRQFLASAIALLLLPRRARAMRLAGPHPTPRPGITAAKVLTSDKLGGKQDLIALFDGVRAIPEVVDGIRCQCGCANSEGFYSLLSCYEGDDAMAKICHICQGEGRLAVRLHKEGKSLDAIRTAIDAKFG